MLAVLASRYDREASALAASWGSSASVLTPRDLSTLGWRFEPADLSQSMAVIEGRVIPFSEITGVLTLLPRVFDQELSHIIDEDRRYVAGEMTAFLVAWLTALPCPVVNWPHPSCLNGPPWSSLRWQHEAVRAGFRLSERCDAFVTLSIIGDEYFGVSDQAMVTAARRLASAADVDILSIRFDEQSAVVSANSRPNLSDPSVAVALKRMLDGRLR